MEENTLMSNLLLQACTECAAEVGKRDDEELIQRLYNHMYENYESMGQPWNYTIIDNLIAEWEKEVEFRNLDGVYFRVHRNGKWQNICFSDLTEEEKDKMLESKNSQWLRNLCKALGSTIRRIGDQLDIRCGNSEEE
jgi:hypothetical protein